MRGAGRTHPVVLIPGDGSGPELIRAATRVLDAAAVAAGARIDWHRHLAGAAAFAAQGTPVPGETVQALRDVGVALKGPLSTPVGTGYRSANLHLRAVLDLYACVRPCRSRICGGPWSGVDLVVVRENTEDVYAGLELAAGTDATRRALLLLERCGLGPRPADSAISVRPVSSAASARIARFAFEYAVRHHRAEVSCGTDRDLLPETDGTFAGAFWREAGRFPGIRASELDLDVLCHRLVRRPADLDVVVLPNLYGDVISDVTAALVGGLGVAPSANLGPEVAMFEATHGSAPEFAGSGTLNPTALILAGAMLLAHIGEQDAAAAVERAVDEVLASGTALTADLRRPGSAPAVGTEQFADAVIDRLRVAAVGG